MVRVGFEDDQAWRDCCDLPLMVRRWGKRVARQISHRLQQLEAMESLADLAVLPFDHQIVDGTVIIRIDEDIYLVMRPGRSAGGTGMEMTTLVVSAIVERSRASSGPL